MSQCQHRIGERCGLPGMGGIICPHLVYDGKCGHANLSSLGRVTFGIALEVLCATYPNSKSDINGAFRIIMSYGNWRADEPIESVSYCDAEKVARMLEERYSPNSIVSFLSWIYRIGGNRFRGEWDRRKLSKPVFDRYSHKVPKRKPPEMTWEQSNKLEMIRLQQREIALDESNSPTVRLRASKIFLFLWIGRWFGARTEDACTMTWGNVKYLSGIPHLCYTPHKTEELGTDVCWPIGNDAWNEILPFKKDDPNEPMIPIEEKYRHKDFKGGKHTRIGVKRQIGRIFRSLGFDDWAAFYNYRYYDAQNTNRSEGEKAVAAKQGRRSEKVGREHYYNPNDHRLVI